MNKFNALGMEVLDYKTEYLKNYPQLVHDSIALAIDSKNTINEEIKTKLKDTNFSYDDFKKYLLTEAICLKTYEELLVEYEAIRAKLDNALLKNEISKNLKTFSKVENEQIQIVQEFVITEDFIKNYFTIENEKDFEILMSRKGFIEKFAILRLTKIFDDFLKTLKDDNLFSIKHSLVFFNSDSNVYGIHLEYNISIEELEKENQSEVIANKILEIAEKANKNYNDRMLV